jgi:hypothetical protein
MKYTTTPVDGWTDVVRRGSSSGGRGGKGKMVDARPRQGDQSANYRYFPVKEGVVSAPVKQQENSSRVIDLLSEVLQVLGGSVNSGIRSVRSNVRSQNICVCKV